MKPVEAQKLLSDTSSVKSISGRLKAPSPKLFKNISTIMISLSGLGTALLGVPATLQALGVEFHFPAIVNQISAYMIVAGIIGTFISKLTVDMDKVEEIASQSEPKSNSL